MSGYAGTYAPGRSPAFKLGQALTLLLVVAAIASMVMVAVQSVSNDTAVVKAPAITTIDRLHPRSGDFHRGAVKYDSARRTADIGAMAELRRGDFHGDAVKSGAAARIEEVALTSGVIRPFGGARRR